MCVCVSYRMCSATNIGICHGRRSHSQGGANPILAQIYREYRAFGISYSNDLIALLQRFEGPGQRTDIIRNQADPAQIFPSSDRVVDELLPLAQATVRAYHTRPRPRRRNGDTLPVTGYALCTPDDNLKDHRDVSEGLHIYIRQVQKNGRPKSQWTHKRRFISCVPSCRI